MLKPNQIDHNHEKVSTDQSGFEHLLNDRWTFYLMKVDEKIKKI